MGWTPLHTAARDGDLKRLKRCVEEIKWLEPLDVNAQTNGHVEAMQYILGQKGSEINAETKLGNSALHLAALNAREPACKLLVSNGIDPQKANKAGKVAAELCPNQADDLKKYLKNVTDSGPMKAGDHDVDEV